jgi:hypothetical protein
MSDYHDPLPPEVREAIRRFLHDHEPGQGIQVLRDRVLVEGALRASGVGSKRARPNVGSDISRKRPQKGSHPFRVTLLVANAADVDLADLLQVVVSRLHGVLRGQVLLRWPAANHDACNDVADRVALAVKVVDLHELIHLDHAAAPGEDGHIENTPVAVLDPDQQLVFNRITQEVITRPVDSDLYTSWKDGQLSFKDHTFEEIARRLERWYGVKIDFKNETLKQTRFCLTFTLPISIIWMQWRGKTNWESRSCPILWLISRR